jgi:NTE family protein
MIRISLAAGIPKSWLSSSLLLSQPIRCRFAGYRPVCKDATKPEQQIGGTTMADGPGAPSAAMLLRSTAIFRELSNDQLAEIWSRAKVHNLLRGDILVRQGSASDSVYVVVSGRFEVWIEGQKSAISEIGVGEPIGEIGFFAGTPRTANIIAARDSVVLELDRASFDAVVRQVPAIHQTLLRTLARRLAVSSARVASEPRAAAARTVAVIAGGSRPIPQIFYDRLDSVVGRRGKGRLLTRDYLQRHFPGRPPDDPTVSDWLNAIEHEYELIAYLADDTLTDWTRKAIRQADQVLVVVSGAGPEAPNAVEAFAFATHPPARRRMVRLHERRSGWVTGTARWLDDRDVGMHHHVSLEDDRDFKSLHRFLTGRAAGYVGAGGGGFGPAHIGVFKAFAERGARFDMLGGTSVGAALLGGFALLMSPEEVDQRTHDVFVTSRAFRRLTFPRYAVLDHVPFDEALQRQFNGINVEDAWRPYFAVATVLDGSSEGPYLLRRGPLWKAVRASGSLPAVLPPIFTDDGRMLVDGAVTDNIPLRPMKALKAGPNLVVHFGARAMQQRFEVDYTKIPGRWGLARRMLTPSGRRGLPDVPNPVSVLQRCLVMHQRPELLPVGPLDLVLTVPTLPGANFMDFDRHSDVFEAAYQWCCRQIDELADKGDPALTAILATKD